MKKFLVTGGSGFIGSNLVKFLLKKNYFVINIDKLSYSANPYNLKRIIKNKKYKFFKADIKDQVLIYNILSRFKPDGIFNLAAETHVDRSIDDPKNFINANILGVYNLIEALRKFSRKYKKKLSLFISQQMKFMVTLKNKRDLMKNLLIILALLIQHQKQAQII